MFEPGKTPGSVDIDFQTADQPVQFRDCLITPLPVMHGNLLVYGFRINDLAYITDANHISEETLSKIKGCKVLVLNALRWSPPHPTHFTVSEAVDVAELTGIPEVYFVHMSTYVVHAEASAKLPPHMRLAYDQQVVYL
jgi:phosphoribosyl 1,2-cyclic phosphate phosphodiesterase